MDLREDRGVSEIKDFSRGREQNRTPAGGGNRRALSSSYDGIGSALVGGKERRRYAGKRLKQ